eukprot:m.158107 g.158107  ORF g.158107 m.158107 type:complete len:217 (+) comp17594_c0_seq2:396-1046(+)
MDLYVRVCKLVATQYKLPRLASGAHPCTWVSLTDSMHNRTRLGRALARRFRCDFVEADHYHPDANVQKIRQGEPLTDEDGIAWLRAVRRAALAWQHSGRHVILAFGALRRRQRDRVVRGLSQDETMRLYLQCTQSTIAHRLLHEDIVLPPGWLEQRFRMLEEPEPDEACIVINGDEMFGECTACLRHSALLGLCSMVTVLRETNVRMQYRFNKNWL